MIQPYLKMNKNKFKFEGKSFRDLMTTGLTYRFCPHKVTDAFPPPDCKRLWESLLDIMIHDDDKDHRYLGQLFLMETEKNTFGVIDKHQNLATISIIILAALNNIRRLIDAGDDVDKNKERMQIIFNSYVLNQYAPKPVKKPKLILEFNKKTIREREMGDLLSPAGLKYLDHQLSGGLDLMGPIIPEEEFYFIQAFAWFDSKIKDNLRTSNNDVGLKLADMVEILIDRFFFAVFDIGNAISNQDTREILKESKEFDTESLY